MTRDRTNMGKRLRTVAAATLGVAAFVALACVRAYACQPCESTLDLARSLEQAEVVAVARRREGARPLGARGAERQCDELLVEKVLKGEVKGGRLRVRSFYGMCPYGFVLGEGSYVVILGKASPSDYENRSAEPGEECAAAPAEGAGLYVPVRQGCAVKALLIEAGTVEAEEGSRVTLEEFSEKYGLREGAVAGEPLAEFFGAWPGAGLKTGFGDNFFGRAGVPLPFEVTK
ncbi:MAG: hypothetical protein ABW208_12310 [Pyrinomonadaceae bacterium]